MKPGVRARDIFSAWAAHLLALALAFVCCGCATKTPSVSELILACAAKQIDMCGDLICEGDLDPNSVIAGTTSAILYCLEYPEGVGSFYFRKEEQAEQFRGTVLDERRE